MSRKTPQIVGSLLFAAALLKAWDGSACSSQSTGIAWPSLGWFAVIAIELVLAAACVVAFRPRITRIALVALFMCFSAYTAYLLAIGSESCGCFGPVTIHPGWTLALDIVV